MRRGCGCFSLSPAPVAYLWEASQISWVKIEEIYCTWSRPHREAYCSRDPLYSTLQEATAPRSSALRRWEKKTGSPEVTRGEFAESQTCSGSFREAQVQKTLLLVWSTVNNSVPHVLSVLYQHWRETKSCFWIKPLLFSLFVDLLSLNQLCFFSVSTDWTCRPTRATSSWRRSWCSPSRRQKASDKSDGNQGRCWWSFVFV